MQMLAKICRKSESGPSFS